MDGFLEVMGFAACVLIVVGVIGGGIGCVCSVIQLEKDVKDLWKRVRKLEGRVQDTDGTD